MEATGLDGQAGTYAHAPVPSRVHAGAVYVIVGIPNQIAFADVRRVFRGNLLGLGVGGSEAGVLCESPALVDS